jgi:parallel beta-helix repeat protein
MFTKRILDFVFVLFLVIILLMGGCTVPSPTPITHTITATAGENGLIEPAGEVSIIEGGNQTFVIAPEEGYQIADVLVDGQSVGAIAIYTFTNIQQNHNIQAIFEQQTQLEDIPTKSYIITATAGTGGIIDPEGSVKVEEGEDQIFTITEEAGYQIADVLVDSVSVGAIPAYTFEDVVQDHTIEVSFIPLYTLTMSVSGEGSTSPAVGTYTYPAGTVVDITASPSPGCYSFTEWSGSVTGMVNPTTVTMNANKTVTANFELGLKKVYNVSTSTQYDTIQEAIDAAATGIIFVCPGIYYEDIEFNNKNITVESANPSDPAIVATTIIQGTGSDSVVKFVGGDTSSLAGFTIRGGNMIEGGGIYIDESDPHIEANVITNNRASEGGGIYIYDSNPIVAGNTITGNTATGRGGGIFVYHDSTPLIINNTITSNTGNSTGGGMTVDSNSAPTINGNTIIGNTTSGDGGGIHISYSSDSTIGNNTIIGNIASGKGGGMHVAYNSPSITGNTINDNSTIVGGGGIYLYDSSSILIGNTITGNTADSTGGGIYIDESGYPNISSNNIRNNDAPYGGGIYVFDSTPYINSNIIEGNSAVYGGGIDASNCDPQIVNNDFIDNMANNDGGGIYVNSDSDLTPYDPRPDGWGNLGDPESFRRNIPYGMIPYPAEGVEYYIAGNKFLGNEHSNPFEYTEGAHVYFE